MVIALDRCHQSKEREGEERQRQRTCNCVAGLFPSAVVRPLGSARRASVVRVWRLIRASVAAKREAALAEVGWSARGGGWNRFSRLAFLATSLRLERLGDVEVY